MGHELSTGRGPVRILTGGAHRGCIIWLIVWSAIHVACSCIWRMRVRGWVSERGGEG